MNKRYVVELTSEERQRLEELVSKGKAPARQLTHARVLLLADKDRKGKAKTDERISDALGCGTRTVERVRQAFVLEGLEAALKGRKRPPSRPRKVDGRVEAQLVTLACSEPPEGHERWTLRLLAGRMVELEIVDSLSHETVRKKLKKNDLKPWREKQWCIPPQKNAEFVAHMEDVLDVYERPYDPKRPVVCLDETSKQLVAETRTPQPHKPGKPRRYDYEYQRNGVCNVFMSCEPLRGWRHVEVTDRRTKVDWAQMVRDLVDVHYPDAERVVLIQDNLNTHTPASLYEAFPPEEAKRIWDRLELHYTPKHGSWLNVAEIELSVLTRQCLCRRIPTKLALKHQAAAWENKRNLNTHRVNWQFTSRDARIRLTSLYPSIEG